jgi:hypothetical protein
MKRGRGRPVLGGLSGFFFGVFVDLLLLTLGVLASDDVVLVVIPLALLVLGVAWGAWAPMSRREAR